MRLRKTIKIDETEFVVRELTIREIIDYFQNLTNKAESETIDEEQTGEATDTFKFFKDEIQVLLNLALESTHTVEDLIKMAPSELKKLYTTFEEVNEVFFGIAAQMGLQALLKDLKNQIRTEFLEVLVNSSSAAIKKSLITVTPTS